MQWAQSTLNRTIDCYLTACDTIASIVSKRAIASKKHVQVARDVLLNGKSFRQAAVSAGYTQNSADLGPRAMRAQIPGLDQAFQSVSKAVEWRPNDLRQIAVSRITKTCLDDKNSDNLKAAELIGRFKSVDLFVRNGDAQVGIFFGAVEASDNDIASLAIDNLAVNNSTITHEQISDNTASKVSGNKSQEE